MTPGQRGRRGRSPRAVAGLWDGRPRPAPGLTHTLPPEVPRCSAAAASSPTLLHPFPAPLRPLNLRANPP